MGGGCKRANLQVTGLGRNSKGRSFLGVRFLLLVLLASALCSRQSGASIPSNFAEAKGLNVFFFFFEVRGQIPFFGGEGDDLV